MDMKFCAVLFVIISVISATPATANDDDGKKQESEMDHASEGTMEDRLSVLEDEVQRIKTHLSQVENLLDVWLLNSEQGDEQQPSLIVNGADAGWFDGNGDGGLAKRVPAGYAFMGSRGKRRQPFIMGSGGKRANLDEVGNSDGSAMKRAYFYGSRGKKQYHSDNENKKRFAFMGSRGKK